MVKIDVETQFKKSLVTWSRKGRSEQTLNFAWPNTLRKLHKFLSSSVSDDCMYLVLTEFRILLLSKCSFQDLSNNFGSVST